jgi:hypothetical protein
MGDVAATVAATACQFVLLLEQALWLLSSACPAVVRIVWSTGLAGVSTGLLVCFLGVGNREPGDKSKETVP